MFFRNLTMLRFPTTLRLDALEDGARESALKPVGPLELASRGFVSPLGRDHEAIAHSRGDHTWLAIGSETRLLPGSVVASELAKRIAEIEQREGRKPGGRARKALKDQLIAELLPRTLVKPGRTDAYLDAGAGVLFVDTSSRKTAESVASEIRRALGSFPALPLNAEVAPRAVLTGWLAGDQLPEGFTLGDEAVLEDAAGDGTVRLTRQELSSDEVGKHLEAGKQCTRLGLIFGDHDGTDRLSFTLGEDLVVRKLRVLDGAADTLESTERDDLLAELDARFALFTGEVGLLFEALERALRISKAVA